MTTADAYTEYLDALCGVTKGLMNFVGIGPEPQPDNEIPPDDDEDFDIYFQ